jgi:TldD protein
MEQDIIDYTLEYAQSKKVEYAEVRGQSQALDGIALRDGILEAYARAVDSGFCVRIMAEGGIGFASTNRWSKSEAKDVVDLEFKYARAANRKDKLLFAEEKSVKTKWSADQKKKIQDVPTEERVATLTEVHKTLTSCGVKIAAATSQCSINLIKKYFVNSEGSRISSFVPKIGAQFFITVTESGKTEQASEQFGYSGGWEAFDHWNVAEKMVHDAKVLRNVIAKAKALKSGTMDLVCGPEVAGIAAHESCGHPMEADRILGREMSQAGRSFVYKGGSYWVGTRIGSDAVTVVDDPTLKNSYGYYLYDDEGVKARRRFLYKKGVINEFLQNRESAAKMNTRSNGSSRSENYDREAIVRMANTFVLPGELTEEELIEDVKHGVCMKSFTEWNIDDKRFNERYVGREAYVIENGELTHPLARPIIETTTQKFWTAVDGVSKKVEFDSATCGKGDPQQGAPVFTGGPSLRLRRMFMK